MPYVIILLLLLSCNEHRSEDQPSEPFSTFIASEEESKIEAEINPQKKAIFIVRNPANADFYIPPSPQFSPVCRYSDHSVRNSRISKEQFQEKLCGPHPSNCADLRIQVEGNAIFESPMRNLNEWAQVVPHMPLMINTSWYQVYGIDGFPYRYPCTNLIGYHLADGREISAFANKDSGAFFWFASLAQGRTIGITDYATMQPHLSQIKLAFEGMFIIKHGKGVEPDHHKYPTISVAPHTATGRTALGILPDGSLLVWVNWRGKEGHGLESLREELLKRGVVNGMLLDGGGSSNVRYIDVATETMLHPQATDAQGVRPIPSFLGIDDRSSKALLLADQHMDQNQREMSTYLQTLDQGFNFVRSRRYPNGLLGRGATSTAYLVKGRVDRKLYTVKIYINPEDPLLKDALAEVAVLQEAAHIQGLRYEAIPFKRGIVKTFISGEPLSHWMETGKLFEDKPFNRELYRRTVELIKNMIKAKVIFMDLSPVNIHLHDDMNWYIIDPGKRKQFVTEQEAFDKFADFYLRDRSGRWLRSDFIADPAQRIKYHERVRNLVYAAKP